jgi:phage portal protein BeeE
MVGAAFLAVNTLANQVAACEYHVYERTPDPHEADLELSWSEPVCRVLHNPNDDDDWSDFSYQVSQQLSLTGTALVWKPAEGDEVPQELYVLPSAACLPWPPSELHPGGSYLVQPYYGPWSSGLFSGSSAAGARIPAEQVIRIQNPNPLIRYDGYAVLTAIRRQVDTIESIDLARWNTQQKGADPSIAVTFDPTVFNPNNQADFNRVRTQLEALYQGPQNAGRLFPLPIGSTATKLSQTPAEMAWTEGWDQLLKFVTAAYGCPAPIAGLTDSTAYATLYASLKQFNLISLDPHLRRIASKLNSKYVQMYYGGGLYLKLTGQRVTDEDVEIRRYTLGLSAKSVKRNEMRRFLELAPLEGPDGDELVGVQKQTQTERADGSGDQQQDPDVERSRPDNPQGNDSLGPRKALLNGFERHRTNGSITPLNGDAAEYMHKFMNGR